MATTMEYRTKTEIIQDIERHRKESRRQSRRSKTSDTVQSLNLGLKVTREAAAKGYVIGCEQMQRLEKKLQAHTYGAIGVALSAGAILGLMAGHKLKSRRPADSDGNNH